MSMESTDPAPPRSGRARGRYGIDAPAVPVGLVAGSVALVVLGLMVPAPGAVVAGLLLLVSAACFLYTTRVGKFVVWDRLLEGLALRGNEQVLDVGCGRGAVLLRVAQLLPRGRAVGIDVWRSSDQSGNTEEATRHNAQREGVAERVDLHTGDMRALPFEDESFDVVVSSLAVHNIKERAGRLTALTECARVLRPGGALAIADIQGAGDYAARLQELGLRDVRVRGVGWRGWFGGPWMATRVVTAKKATADGGSGAGP